MSPFFFWFRFDAKTKYLPSGLNIGKPSKPLATVTFHTKSRIPYFGNVFLLVRWWLELRKRHTETLQKPLENVAFPSILEEHRAPQETWASRRSPVQIKRLIVGRFTKHSAFHVIWLFNTFRGNGQQCAAGTGVWTPITGVKNTYPFQSGIGFESSENIGNPMETVIRNAVYFRKLDSNLVPLLGK